MVIPGPRVIQCDISLEFLRNGLQRVGSKVDHVFIKADDLVFAAA
jgi:hypothetical protein